MQRGVDTNILVYAQIASLPEHATAKHHLEEFVARPESSLVVAPIVLHEFIHIITDGPIGRPSQQRIAHRST